MGLEETDKAHAEALRSLRLCEAFLTLNEERLSIDKQLAALPVEETAEREKLFVRLADIADQMSALLSQLAPLRSGELAAIRTKAAVLSLVLRTPEAGGMTTEAMALALSLADEVVSLP